MLRPRGAASTRRSHVTRSQVILRNAVWSCSLPVPTGIDAFPMSRSAQPCAPKTRNKLLHAAIPCGILAAFVALSLTTATAARRLDSEGLPLPTDAELTQVIVGTWKV